MLHSPTHLKTNREAPSKDKDSGRRLTGLSAKLREVIWSSEEKYDTGLSSSSSSSSSLLFVSGTRPLLAESTPLQAAETKEPRDAQYRYIE